MFNAEALKKRLESFGYSVTDKDGAALNFCLQKTLNTIKNETNQPEMPEGLECIAIDMAAGEFLLSKKTFAPESISGLNLEYAVKQILTGDTNTVFAVGEGCMTPEQRLTAFINYLLTYGKSEFNSYRKLKW